jgi:hypothetical protein
MSETCPECGETFSYLGLHWDRGKCDIPKLGEERKELIKGILLGDGYLMRQKKPRLRVQMTNKEFLEWLDAKFGVLASGGVTVHRTAGERAEKDRNSGFNPIATEEAYSDTYEWHTRSHDGLSEFAAWYESGKKVPPDSIVLTPSTLKMWYICDGSMEIGSRGRPRIKIAASDFFRRDVALAEWFERIGFSPTIVPPMLQFGHDQSERLLGYMGEPIPGFRQKW